MKKQDLQRLVNLRKELHRYPELSGREAGTAQRIKDFFLPLSPSETIENLGGEGLAFIFEGKEKGPSTLIRCELDGLPIQEETNIKHRSSMPNTSHSCGHDGHMAIVAGVGTELANQGIQKGRVILLYQPAEETGEGAAKIIKDKQFKKIQPDFAFALHNLPGYSENKIVLKKGPFAAASKGMIIHLQGRTSHAAHPEDGNSPAEAMAKLIVGLQAIPAKIPEFCLITVINAELGEIAFGTTPGKAAVRATLRSYNDETMETLTDYAEKLSAMIAAEYHLGLEVSYTETFPSTVNATESWNYANEAAKALELKTKHIKNPFRWSEDFGHFSALTSTMIFGLGAGEKQPQLHEANYDFPDKIISTGVNMFSYIIRQING